VGTKALRQCSGRASVTALILIYGVTAKVSMNDRHPSDTPFDP
jgi:hypothetical protein